MNYSIGIIGGADGPAAIYLSSRQPQWISWSGLAVVVLILLPNILYALRFRGQKNRCHHRGFNILEQIGRYGCMLFMVFPAGLCFAPAWPFAMSIVAELILFLLLAGYWIFWVLYFRQRTLYRAVTLAVIPTSVFLLWGIRTLHPVLIVLAIVFGIGHTHVTRCNAIQD